MAVLAAFRTRLLDFLFPYLFLPIGLCLLVLYGIPAWLVRESLIAYRQRRALSGLSLGHRRLLRRLWEQENVCRNLGYDDSSGDMNLLLRCDTANQLADALIAECRQAGIPDWRTDAFRIRSYDNFGPFPLVM